MNINEKKNHNKSKNNVVKREIEKKFIKQTDNISKKVTKCKIFFL